MKRIIPFIIIIILVFILKNIIFSINNLVRNESTVRDLENQLASRSMENKFLLERLKYVKSNEFIEKEAREKLGLSRDGEIVVLFPLRPQTKDPIKEEKKIPNWKLWLELFL